jgi:hypothetical protein
MSKEAEYRGFAASCINLARGAREDSEKNRLLAMAEAWLNLSERAAHSTEGHQWQNVLGSPGTKGLL